MVIPLGEPIPTRLGETVAELGPCHPHRWSPEHCD